MHAFNKSRRSNAFFLKVLFHNIQIIVIKLKITRQKSRLKCWPVEKNPNPTKKKLTNICLGFELRF